MINLGAHKIGTKYKPFIIAEMSGNHNGSLKRALEIVKKAASCGVSAIKLQTYTPDTMTIKSKKRDFIIFKGYCFIRKFNIFYYELVFF